MHSSVQSDLDTLTITLTGTLDADGASALRPLLEQVAAVAIRAVVFDMNEVASMDGSGVGALAFTFKRLAARGVAMRVAGAQGQPLSVMRKLGLDRTFGLPRPASRRLPFAAALGLARAA
jgi:stage II sporulation protein AA (anti-sigma F factor antagonist)